MENNQNAVQETPQEQDLENRIKSAKFLRRVFHGSALLSFLSTLTISYFMQDDTAKDVVAGVGITVAILQYYAGRYFQLSAEDLRKDYNTQINADKYAVENGQ